MIHLYKAGGAWKHGDLEYTVKAFPRLKVKFALADGWVKSLDELTEVDGKTDKQALQALLDEAGIEYDKRWGVDKLEALLNGGQN